MDVKIKTALISVSDKTGIIELAKNLSAMGVKIISTGGTAKALAQAGVNVVSIDSVTGFPEMMDGRVKTLHPKIHGALLGVRDNSEHQAAMKKHGIEFTAFWAQATPASRVGAVALVLAVPLLVVAVGWDSLLVRLGIITERNQDTISSPSWFSPRVFIRMMPISGREPDSRLSRQMDSA